MTIRQIVEGTGLSYHKVVHNIITVGLDVKKIVCRMGTKKVNRRTEHRSEQTLAVVCLRDTSKA